MFYVSWNVSWCMVMQQTASAWEARLPKPFLRWWERASRWAGRATDKTCIHNKCCWWCCVSLCQLIQEHRGGWTEILGSEASDRLKNTKKFYLPQVYLVFHWGWYHSNINKIFGIRKLESRGNSVALFVWSYVSPFLTQYCCDKWTDGWTHDDS